MDLSYRNRSVYLDFGSLFHILWPVRDISRNHSPPDRSGHDFVRRGEAVRVSRSGKAVFRQRALDTTKRIRNVVAFTSLASFSGLLLIVRDPTAIVYVLSFGLLGIGYTMVYAISQATLIAETAVQQRGVAAGLFESSIGLGGAIGPTIAGLVTSSTLAIAFVVPVVALALVLGLLFFLSRTMNDSAGRVN